MYVQQSEAQNIFFIYSKEEINDLLGSEKRGAYNYVKGNKMPRMLSYYRVPMQLETINLQVWGLFDKPPILRS